jgi:hypothetical protein
MLVALPLFGGGCAFGDRKVLLTYPPGMNMAQRNAAQALTPPPNAQNVVLLSFIDQRPQKDRVGEVRNGFGMHTADVLASSNVADWVTLATEVELKKAGFRVTVLKVRPGSGDDPVVSGEVLKVHCGAYFKYGGEIEFAVRVEKGGRTLIQKTYQGKGSAGTNWAATSESYGAALGEALQSAAQNFSAELQREISPTLAIQPAVSP